jgi:hypothetical protein
VQYVSCQCTRFKQSANEFFQSKACFRKKAACFFIIQMPPSQIVPGPNIYFCIIYFLCNFGKIYGAENKLFHSPTT